jgi:hypothetical protein
MSQSKKMSLFETLASTAIGYVVAVAAQSVIFPMFGLVVSLQDNMLIGVFFTVVSVVRGYAVRRMFNYLGRMKSLYEIDRANKEAGLYE